jgi:hypothetical protein
MERKVSELLRERPWAGEDVPTLAILLARHLDAHDGRKPSGPRVERPGDPLARPADAQGQIERRVRALRDDAIDLLGQGEHDHAVSVAPQQLEERSGEGGGG